MLQIHVAPVFRNVLKLFESAFNEYLHSNYLSWFWNSFIDNAFSSANTLSNGERSQPDVLFFCFFFTIIQASCALTVVSSFHKVQWHSGCCCELARPSVFQNPNVDTSSSRWTTALQQLKCQLWVPVGRAAQLYGKYSEHSCIVKSLTAHWPNVWCFLFPPFPFVNNVSTPRLGFTLMSPLGFSCCSSFHLNLMQTSGLFWWHPAGTCPSCTERRQRIRNTGVQEGSVFSEETRRLCWNASGSRPPSNKTDIVTEQLEV